MTNAVGSKFELSRVGRLELVCRDIARTSTFYQDALGMRVVNRVQIPGEAAQRVVFDVGDGALLVFLWFPSVRPAEPNGSRSWREPVDGPVITAHGSIQHVTFEVSVERFDAFAERLKAKGVPVSLGFEREQRPTGAGEATGQQIRRRSLHCLDPDGISLEFACWPAPSVTRAREAMRTTSRSAEAALEPA